MSEHHTYKDRRTGSVIATTNHKLSEVFPGLVEMKMEDMDNSLEEVAMSREEKIDYIDSYIKDTLDLIPIDERASFEASIPAMKDFLLHSDGLHFYAKLEDLKKNREKSTLIYGYRAVDASEDELLMIRGGLVEENGGRALSA